MFEAFITVCVMGLPQPCVETKFGQPGAPDEQLTFQTIEECEAYLDSEKREVIVNIIVMQNGIIPAGPIPYRYAIDCKQQGKLL